MILIRVMMRHGDGNITEEVTYEYRVISPDYFLHNGWTGTPDRLRIADVVPLKGVPTYEITPDGEHLALWDQP